ncbi:hypothetical protein BDV34DRAFT_230519 [Aspergillus parasiticus]|uniref:Uncharacterized protein n=1 Tax=Aspergillus parasiticus TaxID=5067 RepID=A0A5N6D4F0_ASPPA|nr:hypothetical protein BDV34DRAFT_230519 [Aspergillus parasiticus]
MKTTFFSVFALASLFACPGGAVPISNDTDASVASVYNCSAPIYIRDSKDTAGDAGTIDIPTDVDETSPRVKRAPGDRQWKFVPAKYQGAEDLPSGNTNQLLPEPADREWKFVPEKYQGDENLPPGPSGNYSQPLRFIKVNPEDKTPTAGPSHQGQSGHRPSTADSSDSDGQWKFIRVSPHGGEYPIARPSGNDDHQGQSIEEGHRSPTAGPSRQWQFHQMGPEDMRQHGGDDLRFGHLRKEPVWRYGTCHLTDHPRYPHGLCAIAMDRPRPGLNNQNLEWQIACKADEPCGGSGIGSCSIDISDEWHIPPASCT